MKTRLAVAGLLMLFVLVLVTSAQKQKTPVGVRKLIKLPPLGTDAKLDEYRCGDYFVIGGFGGNPPGIRIGFFMEEEPGDPKDSMLAGLFLLDKFRTIIVDSPIPTAEITRKDGDLDEIIIRISQKEYEKSRCLPKPKRAKDRKKMLFQSFFAMNERN